MGYTPISKRNIQAGEEGSFLRLGERLRAEVLLRVRAGEVTERGLARRTAISQPHLHNVLSGARSLTPVVGDLLINALGIRLSDLMESGGKRVREAPFLEGPLGGGHPFPSRIRPGVRLPVLLPDSRYPRQPAAAEVSEDPDSGGTFRTGDFVLLDLDPAARLHFRPGAWLVVVGAGGAYLRRVWLAVAGLWCAGDAASQRTWIPLSGGDQHILEVLGARVVWIGRTLEPAAALDGTPEEIGAEY
ncbi:MAG: helix-turn-helix domain-containing protein [Bryobacteraceae bacterium]